MNRNLGKFSFDLYHELDKDVNIFFSGYSISCAFALAYLGAKDETRNEIAKVLRFSDSDSILSDLMKIGKDLNTDDGKVKTLVSNALWIQKEFGIKDPFDKDDMLELIKRVDYSYPEDVRKTINDWTEEKTNGMIKELVSEGAIDQRAGLTITNAVYFDGKWDKSFNKDNTIKRDFHNLDESIKSVDLMYKKLTCPYYENGDYQMVKIPYGSTVNPVASLIILLPKGRKFKIVEENLSFGNFTASISQMVSTRDVDLYVPKFKMDYSVNLSAKLKEKMPFSFSKKADFSGITEDGKLYISDVLHKSALDVSEEGTEAAAATAITMRLCSMDSHPTVFRVDRPFIFAIWNNISDVPMFLGRVVKL